MKKRSLPKGIRKTPTGYQAYIHTPTYRSKRFPPATALLTMRRWREDTRARLRLGGALPAAGTSTLRQDITDYLQQVQTMPTLRDRSDDLIRWLRVFGPDRDRRTITAGEIRAQLETWRAQGYAANTCNHRRTALMSLFTVLDGKNAPNPVKDVPRYRDESLDAPPRALSLTAVAVALDQMRPSRTKARLEVMRWTGFAPATIMRLTPADVVPGGIYVRPRRKGKGSAGRGLPLLPQAQAALADFAKLNAWGSFSTSSARARFRAAAQQARESVMLPLSIWHELEDVTPYQFRHTFLTLIAALTKDDRAVKELGQHADIRTSHRYTAASIDPRLSDALGIVAAALPMRAVRVPEDPEQP